MHTGPRGAMTRLARRVLGARQINQLVRFAPVLELIRELPAGPGTLLDVGSGSRGISALLPPGWQAVSVDADFEDYGAASGRTAGGLGWVLGDARALPFADRAFDVVVAVDLLEHISNDGRGQAVREICRVAGARAIVACPAGAEALDADRRLAQRLGARGRPIPPWLTEHLDNGFPQAAEIATAAAPFGSVQLLRNESIAAHERLLTAELSPVPAVALRLLCRALEAMLASTRRIPRRLAGSLLRAIRGHDRAPAYRAVVAVDIRQAGAAQSGDHSIE